MEKIREECQERKEERKREGEGLGWKRRKSERGDKKPNRERDEKSEGQRGGERRRILEAGGMLSRFPKILLIIPNVTSNVITLIFVVFFTHCQMVYPHHHHLLFIN